MRPRSHTPLDRKGSTATETAIVLPVVLLFLGGLVVGAMGVFQYNQVATLAREGARWASVRGATFASETHGAAATDTTIYSQAILPHAGGLQVGNLRHAVTWDSSSKQPVYLAVPSTNTWRRNQVRVTVEYDWRPAMFFPARTMRSTSVMPITY